MNPEFINIEDAHETLIKGIQLFFNNCKAKKVILGLSGGIDSAVVASLAVEALGKDLVHGFMMPSTFSTLHSIQDAVDLADNLDIKYDVIPISDIYDKFMKELAPVFGPNNKWNVAEENLQARIRGTLLMAYANKFGGIVFNTSNKSELCMGYGTLYGDLAGAVMVIGDLYKTEVYEMAQLINMDEIKIPVSTIMKAPSAELREGQKDSDSLPNYDVLDTALLCLREGKMTDDQILSNGINKEVLDRIKNLIKSSSFKSYQVPPVLNVSNCPVVPKNKCLL